MEDILIKKSKSRDEVAFARLIRNYKSSLYGYIFSLVKNEELAKDLFQEVLLKVWKALPKYRDENKFSSWLFSIAHNKVIDALKNKSYKISKETVSIEKGEITSSLISENFEEKEIKEKVQSIINMLPSKQKEVVLLRKTSNLTFKEIAQITNEPLNTVLSHMNYAVKKIQQVLRKENVI